MRLGGTTAEGGSQWLPLTVLGLSLMLIGPPTLWTTRWGWALWGGVTTFALGWVLVGAGLGTLSRARSAWRGALLAAAVYPVVGLLLMATIRGGLLDQYGLIGLPFVALTWPLHVAIELHLFGLNIN